MTLKINLFVAARASVPMSRCVGGIFLGGLVGVVKNCDWLCLFIAAGFAGLGLYAFGFLGRLCCDNAAVKVVCFLVDDLIAAAS